MKKILVIDESSLFRDYLANKLKENGFTTIQGKSGLDGSVKMRSEMPDLIIMDYHLSRKTSTEVLKEKVENRNISAIPVIMTGNRIDKSKIVQTAKYGVKKFFSKPVKTDALLRGVAEILDVDVTIDTSPCIIEAHLNDQILFVEIARGLNTEKIEILKYRIAELMDLYSIQEPRVLVMMSDIELTEVDAMKFRKLLDTILEHAGSYARYMKILTNSEFVEDFISRESQYKSVTVSDNLAKAMDDLLGLKPDNVAHDEVVRQRLLATSAPKKEKDETFLLRFDDETDISEEGEQESKDITVAVVDDDIIIQSLVTTVLQETGWLIKAYNNGKEFIDNLSDNNPDLVFLDLMMPEMDGFQVLQYLRTEGVKLPIIILSALSQQETVVKAMGFGVRSYLIKPIKPEMLINKTAELLNSNF